MLAAHELEMTRGDWAFLDVEIFHVRRWEKNENSPPLKSVYISATGNLYLLHGRFSINFNTMKLLEGLVLGRS